VRIKYVCVLFYAQDVIMSILPVKNFLAVLMDQLKLTSLNIRQTAKLGVGGIPQFNLKFNIIYACINFGVWHFILFGKSLKFYRKVNTNLLLYKLHSFVKYMFRSLLIAFSGR
jgi:hypothetical protein